MATKLMESRKWQWAKHAQLQGKTQEDADTEQRRDLGNKNKQNYAERSKLEEIKRKREGGEKEEHLPASGFRHIGLKIQDRWVMLLKIRSSVCPIRRHCPNATTASRFLGEKLAGGMRVSHRLSSSWTTWAELKNVKGAWKGHWDKLGPTLDPFY